MHGEDDLLVDVTHDKVDNKLPLTLINTNARSLCPKINSLIDCFGDMEATLGVVTETWLSDGDGLEEDIEHLALKSGLRLLHRNREDNARGFAHGGVSIVFKESQCGLKKMRLHNPGKYEVVAATGNLKGSMRKIVVIGCYIPPNYTVGRNVASDHDLSLIHI